MPFKLEMTSQAEQQITEIMKDNSKQGLQKQLKKALKLLSENPRHPGLNSHPIGEIEGVKVWTSYVQNKTPQAHRILWSYAIVKNTIYILQVVPHY